MTHFHVAGARRALLAATAVLLVLSASVQAAVTLVEFKTERQSSTSVRVTWRTATEIDTIGFFLWRADAESGDFQQIGQFESRGTGVSGADYEYTDDELQPDANYWYRLEDLDGSQSSTFHGPIAIDQSLAATPTPTTAPTNAATPTPTTAPTATPTTAPTATPTIVLTSALVATSTPAGLTATSVPTNIPGTPAPGVTPAPTSPPSPTNGTAAAALLATQTTRAAPLIVETITPAPVPALTQAQPTPLPNSVITTTLAAATDLAAVAAAPGAAPEAGSPTAGGMFWWNHRRQHLPTPSLACLSQRHEVTAKTPEHRYSFSWLAFLRWRPPAHWDFWLSAAAGAGRPGAASDLAPVCRRDPGAHRNAVGLHWGRQQSCRACRHPCSGHRRRSRQR